MLTTPSVAWFHNTLASNSATATLKWARSRSFRLRTTWRLSLSDCAASMRSSRVRKAIIGSRAVGPWSLVVGKNAANLVTLDWDGQRPTADDQRRFLNHRLRRNFFGHEGLDHI